jgi:O-antigen/teichoic acid export membrane protein
VVADSFFLTVAGIAMSFAGFAGLMNTLRRRGEAWAPMELYQLRIIVAYAITTLFGALSTIPFVALFGQREGLQWLGLMMLIVSAALGVGNMLSDIRQGHGTLLPTRVRAIFTTITILGLLAFVGTAISGALPLYQVALILMLAMPAGTFVYVVARLER